jgi:hypothetical protein
VEYGPDFFVEERSLVLRSISKLSAEAACQLAEWNGELDLSAVPFISDEAILVLAERVPHNVVIHANHMAFFSEQGQEAVRQSGCVVVVDDHGRVVLE